MISVSRFRWNLQGSINRLTLTICCTIIIPHSGAVVKGVFGDSRIAPLRRLDAALDLPQHGGGDLMGGLPDGDLRAPAGEEVDVAQHPLRVHALRHGNVQTVGRDDVGAVAGEIGERAFRHLLVHVRHRAVRAGVVKVVLVFPGNLRRRFHDGAVQREAGIARVRLDLPAAREGIFHHAPLVLAQLPDLRQAAGPGVDVRDVEHAQGLVGIVGVDGVNGLAALANPKVVAIPLLHGGAGHGIGPLRGNQQRVFKGVFVKRSH